MYCFQHTNHDILLIFFISKSLQTLFTNSSSFLSILVTSFSIGTVEIMYFPVISPKQVNCFLNFSANYFMKN